MYAALGHSHERTDLRRSSARRCRGAFTHVLELIDEVADFVLRQRSMDTRCEPPPTVCSQEGHVLDVEFKRGLEKFAFS